MTHQEKLEAMYRHMGRLGIARATAAPPAWRLLWRLGFEVPPPLFTPFWPGAIAMGLFFGVTWGVFMWLALWSRQGMPPVLFAAVSLAAGAAFGLIMAAYFRHLARKHGLPAWADYTGLPGA